MSLGGFLAGEIPWIRDAILRADAGVQANTIQPLIQASAGLAPVSLLPSLMEADPLNPQSFFNLADLLLYLAGRPLAGTFLFQAWLSGSFSHLLLDLSLHFVKIAFQQAFGT